MLHQHSIFSPPTQSKITPLTRSDIEELSRIALRTRHETYAEHFTLEELERFYDARYRDTVSQELADKNILYLLYKDNNKIVGFAKLYFLDDGVAKLDKLYFLKQYHRQGLGRQLLERCVAKAIERGCDQMFLHAYHGNAGAIGFYRAQGFNQVGGLVPYVEPSTGEVYPDSSVVMERKNLLACFPVLK